MSGLFQDDKGNASMGRVLAAGVAVGGLVLIGCGVALLFMERDGGELCLMTGAGLITAAMAGKNWQKAVEK